MSSRMSTVSDEPSQAAATFDRDLDPSARLIIDEARRRGIEVTILSPRATYFRLTLGARRVTCRESLSERTSAVALSLCDDKRTTTRLLAEAGLAVPVQIEAGNDARDEAFLRAHGAVVVKPARGEQGRGVSVDVRGVEDLRRAIAHAGTVDRVVLLEQLVRGEDVRVIVIAGQVVAAAVRRPPQITGTGQHSILDLVVAQSLRRAAETAGESKIPLDDELRRCLREAGHQLADVLPAGVTLTVRRAANVHTGGTIHDITAMLHPGLVEAACRAARVLDIPVVGIDMLVSDLRGDDYYIIEANERPGFAHHEPQPVAARFVDFLFPETARAQ